MTLEWDYPGSIVFTCTRLGGSMVVTVAVPASTNAGVGGVWRTVLTQVRLLLVRLANDVAVGVHHYWQTTGIIMHIDSLELLR